MKNKVLVTWYIVYDDDPHKTYSFFDFNKIISSVESSIRGYVGEEGIEFDIAIDDLMKILKSKEHDPITQLRVNDLYISIYRWELDELSDIHKTLCKCYDIVDSDMKHEISRLFQ